MEPQKSKITSKHLFAVHEFRNFLFARFLFTVSLQIQAVIVSWQVYSMTKDPVSLGLVGFFEAVPTILVSFLSGPITDRSKRKTLLLLTVFSLSICSFLLFAFTLDISNVLKTYGVIPIYAVIFLSGVIRGFLAPASFAFLGEIIPRDYYAASSAWIGTSFHIASVLGPAFAGMLYGYYGVQITYLVDLGLILASFLLLIPIATPYILPIPPKESILNSLKEGFKFLRKNEYILPAMALDMFAVLFGGAVALLPIFADTILHVGAEGLGILRASPALGAVLMSLVLSEFPPNAKTGKIFLATVFGFGITMILFGISTNFYFSLFILFLSGAIDSISVVIRSTIFQVLTPDDMRGRISAINKIFVGSSNELGAMESGLAAKLLGTVPSVIFGACMTIGIAIFAWVKFPKLRDLEMEDHI